MIDSDQYKAMENIAGLIPNLSGGRKVELAKKLLESLEASNINPNLFSDH